MTELRYCTFVVGDLLVGLPVTEVLEVLHDQQLTDVPLAPDGVVGMLNLRGHIIPAVDVRRRFGLTPRAAEEDLTHVIVPVLGEQISLVVDAASDVVTVAAEDQDDVPETVSQSTRRLLCASFQLPTALLLVLDAPAVVTPA